MARYDNSRDVHEVASRFLAGSVSGNFRYHTLPVPLCFERGEGVCLLDVDGYR